MCTDLDQWKTAEESRPLDLFKHISNTQLHSVFEMFSLKSAMRFQFSFVRINPLFLLFQVLQISDFPTEFVN